jgi:uncharacterized membrane protein YeaQ/YmgE (transglycosylase-associated protein family)
MRKLRANDKEVKMEQILINLITGALGGVAAGKASPTFDLGPIGNIISGLVGGGLLGQLITLLLPSIVVAAEKRNVPVAVEIGRQASIASGH